MISKIKTFIHTYPSIAANLAIRFGFSALIGMVFPTLCFLLYLARNGVFSYGLFNAGHFGMTVFFYTTALFIAVLALYTFLPVFIWQMTKSDGFRIANTILAVLVTAVAVLTIGLVGYFARPLIMAMLLFGGGYLVTAIGAFKCKNPVQYLAGCTIVTFLIFAIPVLHADYTAKVLGMGLSQFGVGGDIPVQVVSTDGRSTVNGRLVLLAPESIYLRVAEDEVVVVERGPDAHLVYPAKKPRKPEAK